MSKIIRLFRACMCLSITFIHLQSQAASPQLSLALSHVERIQTLADHSLTETRDLRKATTREDVDAGCQLLGQRCSQLTLASRQLDEALSGHVEDPRIDLREIRSNISQMEANARFAALAIQDLLQALDMQDLPMRTRALRELEGGFRFIRLAASEMAWTLREMDRQMP